MSAATLFAALGARLFVAGSLLSAAPRERLLVAGGPPFKGILLSMSRTWPFPAGSLLAMALARLASQARLLMAGAGILLTFARARLRRALLFAAGTLLRMTGTLLPVVRRAFLCFA
jgi:hypothetical protein